MSEEDKYKIDKPLRELTELDNPDFSPLRGSLCNICGIYAEGSCYPCIFQFGLKATGHLEAYEMLRQCRLARNAKVRNRNRNKRLATTHVSRTNARKAAQKEYYRKLKASNPVRYKKYVPQLIPLQDTCYICNSHKQHKGWLICDSQRCETALAVELFIMRQRESHVAL